MFDQGKLYVFMRRERWECMKGARRKQWWEMW